MQYDRAERITDMNKLVELLRKNSRLTNEELAVMLGKSPDEIEREISALENDGLVIDCNYARAVQGG